MATRSMPIPSCRPVSMASLSLVPTPSVAATSTGSLKPQALRSNRPPKPPMPPMQPGALGLGRQRPDRIDQRVAGIDIDAGIAIGQRPCPWTLRAPCHSGWRFRRFGITIGPMGCPSRPWQAAGPRHICTYLAGPIVRPAGSSEKREMVPVGRDLVGRAFRASGGARPVSLLVGSAVAVRLGTKRAPPTASIPPPRSASIRPPRTPSPPRRPGMAEAAAHAAWTSC